MNFRLHGGPSIILMSLRKNAPYADRVEDDGKTLIYEGHDIPRQPGGPYPKNADQPMFNPGGSLTENGKFHKAAKMHKDHGAEADLVKVYEKIKSGIWVYNGMFKLVDAWQEDSGGRKVFKFRLELTEQRATTGRKRAHPRSDLPHNRVIPSRIMLEVYKRDGGKCVICGSRDNLHFDHILPFSKGGTSLKAENIQLLCARHNLEKKDKIE
ncbi:MAG: HNH endonuclease [Phycisphaerae bacterium]|nr:HNH endonuclease [Phycisphaerae bacterium]